MKFIKVAGKKTVTMSNRNGNMNKFMYGSGKPKKKGGK